ncbi:MAG: hypothetical protein K1X53_10420 [Candidatus Sumerlaeaceae bacterium]|nr:hypothetical protein [Candidatus Sumerlaeaceae bacterium]
MERILHGVADYHRRLVPAYLNALSQAAQSEHVPYAAMLTCTDTRLSPNVITGTAPGELFILRNVANIVPPLDTISGIYSDEAEAAAIEYAIGEKRIEHFIICGHSDCGGMKALLENRFPAMAQHLAFWVRHGEPALTAMRAGEAPDKSLSPLNQLVQLNVLLQVRNLQTHPCVREQMAAGKFNIHAWYFDLNTATLQAWNETNGKFEKMGTDAAATQPHATSSDNTQQSAIPNAAARPIQQYRTLPRKAR